MDRKEAIRRYRETPRPAGIYRVTHTPSGRVLLGASPDAAARLRRIRAQLEMSTHPSGELQRDWDTDGESAFVLGVLDVLPPSQDPQANVNDDLETLLDLWTERLDIEPGASY